MITKIIFSDMVINFLSNGILKDIVSSREINPLINT